MVIVLGRVGIGPTSYPGEPALATLEELPQKELMILFLPAGTVPHSSVTYPWPDHR